MSRRGERPSPETLATLPVAVDAMGGDKAPGEIVEGARRAAEQHGVRVVLVGPPEQVGDTQGLELVRLHRGHRHGRGPGRRGAPQEGLLAGAGGRAGARRQGLGHGLGRQHRGDDGRRRCCAWAGCPAWCGPASPPRCPGWAARRPSWSTPAPTPSARPPCSCSSPRWAPPTCRPASAPSRPSVGPALDRRGADEGHAAGQGDPRPAGRGRRRERRHGRLRVRREPRGPGPAALAGRRHRDRRVHRAT